MVNKRIEGDYLIIKENGQETKLQVERINRVNNKSVTVKTNNGRIV